MKTGRLLLLNGCSSSGKSSLARELQALAQEEQFLHLQLDAFRAMEPPGYFDPERSDRTDIRVQALCRAINAAALAYVQHGQNVIIDHVLNSVAWGIVLTELGACDVLLIKVSCELAMVEERERQRPERKPGLARSQFFSVHAGRQYDFEVNTSVASAQESALSVLRWYRSNPLPVALPAMCRGKSAA